MMKNALLPLITLTLLSACTTVPETEPTPPPVIVAEIPTLPPPPPPPALPPPPPPPPDPAEIFVLPKLLALSRHEMTDNIDGCESVQKGLLNNEGFMVFTCEKLLPWHDISQQTTVFEDYKRAASFNGWTIDSDQPQTELRTAFKRTDNLGCNRRLEIMQWTDRSMNETYPTDARDSHRQIIFIQRFNGEACEPYYDVVVDLAQG